MMDEASYKLAQKDFGDPKVQEVQLTTDGEDHYSFARELNDEAKTTLKKDQKGDTKHKDGPRVPAIGAVWAKDSSRFAMTRTDQRKVGDLWVINSLAQPRPTLETYRYAMPGEENVDQEELLVFDRASKQRVTAKADAFKDQSLQIATARTTARERAAEKTEPKWLGDSADTLYLYRSSRDLHRVDVCSVNAVTGAVKPIIEERLNTYIDTQPLWTVNNGQEFIHWSERDGWGHYYLFDANGTLKNQIDSGRVRRRADQLRGREAARDVLHGQRPRGERGPVLHALLPREPRRHRPQAARPGRLLAHRRHVGQREVLHRHLLAGEHGAEVRAVRRGGPEARPTSSRPTSARSSRPASSSPSRSRSRRTTG